MVAPSCKCKPGGTNANHECVERDCSLCTPGNLSDDGVSGGNQSWPGLTSMRGWRLDPASWTVSIAGLCLDADGQLPGGLNYMHMSRCNGNASQRWNLTGAGQLRSLSSPTQCLQGGQWWTWLGRPLIYLGDCQVIRAI